MALLFALCLGDLLSEIQVVPADDRILDKPPAALGNLLFKLFAREKFLVVAKGNGTGEPIGSFAFVKLLFNGLTQLKNVNIAK